MYILNVFKLEFKNQRKDEKGIALIDAIYLFECNLKMPIIKLWQMVEKGIRLGWAKPNPDQRPLSQQVKQRSHLWHGTAVYDWKGLGATHIFHQDLFSSNSKTGLL